MDDNDARSRRNDWWRPAPYQPQMRVSDAERHEIADLLSKYFAEGRLDDVEFNDRLDKAMHAKTRGDLAGLLDDLRPGPMRPHRSPTRHDHRSPPLVARHFHRRRTLDRRREPRFLLLPTALPLGARDGDRRVGGAPARTSVEEASRSIRGLSWPWLTRRWVCQRRPPQRPGTVPR